MTTIPQLLKLRGQHPQDTDDMLLAGDQNAVLGQNWPQPTQSAPFLRVGAGWPTPEEWASIAGIDCVCFSTGHPRCVYCTTRAKLIGAPELTSASDLNHEHQHVWGDGRGDSGDSANW